MQNGGPRAREHECVTSIDHLTKKEKINNHVYEDSIVSYVIFR
jgi:hypothetical protein